LPEKHPARFVVEIVDQIDQRHLKASCSDRGSQPYNPKMLVALLSCGYATGVFSSRKPERSTYTIGFFRGND
jgi:transposase